MSTCGWPPTMPKPSRANRAWSKKIAVALRRTMERRAVNPLSQSPVNRAETVQKEPNGVFSFQRFTSEPERNHPFAKPLRTDSVRNLSETLMSRFETV
jgi:hypothetical protein